MKKQINQALDNLDHYEKDGFNYLAPIAAVAICAAIFIFGGVM